jgi:galactonate dehydratase
MAHIRRSTRTPIASCETLHGRRAYKPFFEQYAMDVAIVDVAWNGALESCKIAAMADTYEVNVATHNWGSPLLDLMSAHVAAAIPNLRIMEYEVDGVPWRDEIVTVAPVVVDGALVLPSGPGWGTEIDEDAVRAHPPKARSAVDLARA